MTLNLKLVVTALTLSVATSAFAAPAKPERIRGSIVSVSADAITIHRNSGDTVVIKLPATVMVGAVKNVKLEDIKPGSFIGTAAKTGKDGKLTATEVLVFPESARGTGEGHYDWDLGPNSTMTNANVDAVVQGTSGRDLKLSYKGGSNNVTVPANVPIVTFAPATRSDLLPGKKVFLVAAGADSDLTAQRVVVEKDGVAPPM
jgi:hypothetical protein